MKILLVAIGLLGFSSAFHLRAGDKNTLGKTCENNDDCGGSESVF
jgi:hypothetical protein